MAELSWFEGRYARYEKQKRNAERRHDHAPELFNALGAALSGIAREATARGLKVESSGVHQTRTLTMDSNLSSLQTAKRQLVVKMSEDRRDVTVRYDAEELHFTVIVDSSNIVNFQHDGDEMSVSAAAEFIMEGFLFGGESPLSEKAILSDR